jgi:hypothetical protein
MKATITGARLLAVGVVCASAGAGAGAIASASASGPPGPGAPAGPRAHHPRAGRSGRAHPRMWARGPGRLRAAVHGSLVVPYRGGFATVTFDRGSVKSLSGQELTITEGTRRATYATLTLAIPTGAIVRDNGRRASLGSLQPGERVVVVRGPAATRVIAHTDRRGMGTSTGTSTAPTQTTTGS